MGFSDDVFRFTEKTKAAPSKIVRFVAFFAFERVLLRSPVDTGRFRASWRLSADKPDLTVATVADGSEPTSTQAIAGIAPGTHHIFITNNLPYAIALENGHSRQAPSGVAGLAFLESKAQLQKLLGGL